MRRSLKIRLTAALSRALVFSIVVTAPAVRAAEPAGEREFSARCAAFYASSYQIPVELVDAIIQVESAWNPRAVSAKGAAGLMQLMPATAIRFGVRNRFDIEENIRGGVAYLAWLIQLFNGDLRLAVAAYQVGESQILSRGLAYSCLGDSWRVWAGDQSGTTDRYRDQFGRKSCSGRSGAKICHYSSFARTCQLCGRWRPVPIPGGALGAGAKTHLRQGNIHEASRDEPVDLNDEWTPGQFVAGQSGRKPVGKPKPRGFLSQV